MGNVSEVVAERFSRAPLEARDIATLDMIFSTMFRYIERLEKKLEDST